MIEETAPTMPLVFGKLAELRRQVGTLKAKKKDGVRFKVRSLDELIDKVRPAADELGLLIYPVRAKGQGHVVEDGTLAECTVTVRITALADGSYLEVEGFGLGADSQDKAGGKAGSYAFKQALIQTLLAGGAEDTDDTDTPIKGGVRKRAPGPSYEAVKAAFEGVPEGGVAEYQAAVGLAKQLKPEGQLQLRNAGVIASAKQRAGLSTP